MIKKILFLFVLQSCGLYFFGQEKRELDSLKSVLYHTETFQQFSACQELYDFYIKSNTDSALKYVDLKIELAEKIGDSSKIAKSIKEKGNVYWTKDNSIEALKYYKTALKIYDQIVDNKGVGTCFNNLGLVNYNFGNYEIATDYYLKALKSFGRNDSNTVVSTINNNLGLIFTEENDYAQAKLYFARAIEINSKLDNVVGIVDNCINLGLIAEKEDSSELAFGYYREALDNSIKINDKISTAVCYLEMANSYGKKKDYKKALEYYNLAVETNISAGNPDRNALNYSNIGLTYGEMGERQKALEYYLKSYKLASSLKFKAVIEHVAHLLAVEYEFKGDYKTAYKYLQISRSYSDSLFNEDTKVNINKLEMKHQFENKVKDLELQQMEKDILQQAELEKQKLIRNYFIGGALLLLLMLIIAIYSYFLKKRTNQQLLIKNAEIESQSEEINLQNEMLIERNEKITEQKEKIEKLNKSKDKIFSIIGHDLRNVVGTTANSLSYLANKRISLDSENTQLLLNELRDNSKRTFTLLENLLSWGKSQMSGITIEPVPFDVSDSINETVGFLNTMAQKKNIEIHTNFDGKTMVFADSESIKTVIRNLISNAIKFTEKNGKIEVSVVEGGGQVKICVNDNGIGISSDEIKKIMDPSKFYTTTGTSHEGGAGLGLSLCLDYLVANNSKLEVKSEEGKGSEFFFYLPSGNSN